MFASQRLVHVYGLDGIRDPSTRDLVWAAFDPDQSEIGLWACAACDLHFAMTARRRGKKRKRQKLSTLFESEQRDA
ncbi:unnamed protein product [Chondrus crispus]|uniref:Uncharacterized protein n=1 Tax=Chondrus crispus TaxID=2769 RepID=R7QS73_CHOCR|nr:unnamed protein product [Chondrus crispus]CDF40235.1 unnamed protein product [Chondrus crispus]|eukprot:XP_005710529.1 unnamed protein product [Chondrus crispus]